jgi:perosamine synthetase
MTKYPSIPISKPTVGQAERDAVMAVLESGMLVQGKVTGELECEWAGAVGTPYAVATNNGTTALHVALLANGVGAGDEVITTPFTFIASVNSILMCNATPVFADILPGCFTIDPSAIEAAITPRTKAIMPVHLYGHPAMMDEIMTIAKKYGISVIEDCAQSIGATYKGKGTGSFGTGAFSLYATKNVMSAEGGMVTTNDEAIARTSKLLREHGSPRRYHHEILGFNYRISDLHAAIGLAQIKQLHSFSEKRQRNAGILNDAIRTLITPRIREESISHVWHQYTVRIPEGGTPNLGLNRDQTLARLTEEGIGCGVFYPLPAYRQPHMMDLAAQQGGVNELAKKCPITERVTKEVLSLPIHPQLNDLDLERIISVVNSL